MSTGEAPADVDLPQIAERVRHLLAHVAVSQIELARQLDISSGYLNDLARGRKRPGTEFLLAVRRKLQVSIDWLLTGDGPMYSQVGIRPDLLRSIRVQVATARAAVVDKDPVAQELLDLIGKGQTPVGDHFVELLDRVAPDDEVLELSVTLYNGSVWSDDIASQRRSVIASALAHFQTQDLGEKLKYLTG